MINVPNEHMIAVSIFMCEDGPIKTCFKSPV